MTRLLATISTVIRGAQGLSRATLNLAPVDEPTLRRRRAICAACPAATRTRNLGRPPVTLLTPASTCAACRCNLYAKTRLADETCPRDRWPAPGSTVRSSGLGDQGAGLGV